MRRRVFLLLSVTVIVTMLLVMVPKEALMAGPTELSPEDAAASDSVLQGYIPAPVWPDAPVISIDPTSLEATLAPDSAVTETLTITNSGDEPLQWRLQEWYEDWDSYPTGQDMHGVGGWKGWGNDPTYTAYTTDAESLSPPNSIDIAALSDLVHEYTIDTGIWTYTAWQFVPAAFSGESYFILLNQYDDGGATNNWSTQVHFESTQNLVIADWLGETLPLIRGEWVEIRVEIDLISDWQEFYYGGDLLYADSWSERVSGGGITSIGAVDLFANGASSVYYDDLSLVETLPDICDFANDIAWLSVSPASGTTQPDQSSIVDVTFDSTGLGQGIYTSTLCVASNDPVNPLIAVPLTMTVVQCIELTDAAISGPTELFAGETGTFTVTWQPPNATPPIDILWDNGMTSTTALYSWLDPGNYTIVVTATNCDGTAVVTATFDVTVTCVDLLSANISGPGQLEPGEVGAYTVTWEPPNATPPIDILWDNGMTSTTALYSWPDPGNYTIVVTATNCDGTAVVTATFDVTVPCVDLLSATISGPGQLEPGEAGAYTVTWEPPNATPPIDILWDNGMTGTTALYSWLDPGNYTTVVTASNCAGTAVVTATFDVTVICVDLLSATIFGPDQLMVGEAGTFTLTWEPPNATPPIDILWSNGLTGTTAVFTWTMPGTYTVVVSATNCLGVTVVDSFDVVVTEEQYSVYLPAVYKND